MDDLIVWPSKKVIDLITVEVDLFDQLPVGVTIISVDVSSLVFQGFDDPIAGSMLYLVPVIHDSLIQQKVKDGIAGNVYNIQFDILLSDGQGWIKTFRLAITPNNTPAVPVFIPLYYTSQPYPIDYLEDMSSTGNMISGSFLFDPHPFDYASSFGQMISGDLRNQLQTYNYGFESMEGAGGMQSGTIAMILRTYVYPAETSASAGSMVSGTLVVILVQYAFHENMISSGSMRSGTLV